MDFLEMFTGPSGGSHAAFYIIGIVTGWGIAQKTIVKRADERVEELKQRIEKLESRLTDVEDSRFEAIINVNTTSPDH
jgi:shikimate 5-dehydrogenase